MPRPRKRGKRYVTVFAPTGQSHEYQVSLTMTREDVESAARADFAQRFPDVPQDAQLKIRYEPDFEA